MRFHLRIISGSAFRWFRLVTRVHPKGKVNSVGPYLRGGIYNPPDRHDPAPLEHIPLKVATTEKGESLQLRSHRAIRHLKLGRALTFSPANNNRKFLHNRLSPDICGARDSSQNSGNRCPKRREATGCENNMFIRRRCPEALG